MFKESRVVFQVKRQPKNVKDKKREWETEHGKDKTKPKIEHKECKTNCIAKKRVLFWNRLSIMLRSRNPPTSAPSPSPPPLHPLCPHLFFVGKMRWICSNDSTIAIQLLSHTQNFLFHPTNCRSKSGLEKGEERKRGRGRNRKVPTTEKKTSIWTCEQSEWNPLFG